MLLPEYNLPVGAMNGAPGPYAAFQGAPNLGPDLGVPAPHLLEDGDWTQARGRLEDGDAHAAPASGMAIAGPSRSDTPRRWKTRPWPPQWLARGSDALSCRSSSD